MPIVLSSWEALQAIENNKESTWPGRGDANRVEPITKPRVTPSFQIERGQRVFSIGSCFSRNIEKAFLSRGFKCPIRDVFNGSLFGPHVLNNFAIPAIFNELSWAFGLSSYDRTANIVEVAPGEHVDLHLNSGMDAASLEFVIERRNAITRAYQAMVECDLILLTLSETECWYDKATSLYLNTEPRRTIIEKNQDRFELHVLSEADLQEKIEHIVEIIQSKTGVKSRLILIISPSPGRITYLGTDVIVGNFAAKSVLRVVVDRIISKYEATDYYPVFEAILHSDRTVWDDDLVHVDVRVLDEIFSHLIFQYLMAEKAQTDEALLEKLRGTAYIAQNEVFGLLEHKHELVASNPDIAVRFIEAALGLRRLSEADKCLRALPSSGPDTPEIAWVRARTLFAQAAFSETLLILVEWKPDWSRRPAFWQMLTTCLFEIGDVSRGTAAIDEWIGLQPNACEPLRLGAVLQGRTGRIVSARQLFSRARTKARTQDEQIRVDLDHGEFLANLGRIMPARAIVENIVATNAIHLDRLKTLKMRLLMK